jgi:hypothetical protein
MCVGVFVSYIMDRQYIITQTPNLQGIIYERIILVLRLSLAAWSCIALMLC